MQQAKKYISMSPGDVDVNDNGLASQCYRESSTVADACCDLRKAAPEVS